MQKRALTLSVAGSATLVAALTAGLVANSHDVSQATDAAGAPKKAAVAPKAGASAAKKQEAGAKKQVARTKALLSGSTTASYFWDDGSGINGDTGAPASGRAMQKGLFASPSWPLGTKVKVSANGRSITGFVGDRGPGSPSHRGVMLDLDTYTFRYLLDGKTPKSKYNAGSSEGHIKGLKWEVLEWGKGAGKKGNPQPL
ncbi:hypothetical protein [Actinocorallia longicatena]|uniref:Uncharacterized protein n=1 Tax=Actinocorallia longicatena TaxID=111803 RepID=A0ABP6QLM9_9ACTN